MLAITTPPDLNTIGGRIRYEREAQGLTQAELARKAEISKPTVNSAETGLRHPHARNLNAIARALNVDPRWLRWGNDGRPPDARSNSPD